MRLTEEVTITTPEDIVYLDYLTLDPTKVDGKIVLSVKSKVFAAWAKSVSAEGVTPVRSTKWGGTYLVLDPTKVLNMHAWWFEGVGNESLIRGTPGGLVPNLGWIRHTKLAEGIEIEFEPNMSAADYEDFIPTVANALKLLYLQNVRQEILSLRMKEIL